MLTLPVPVRLIRMSIQSNPPSTPSRPSSSSSPSSVSNSASISSTSAPEQSSTSTALPLTDFITHQSTILQYFHQYHQILLHYQVEPSSKHTLPPKLQSYGSEQLLDVFKRIKQVIQVIEARSDHSWVSKKFLMFLHFVVPLFHPTVPINSTMQHLLNTAQRILNSSSNTSNSYSSSTAAEHTSSSTSTNLSSLSNSIPSTTSSPSSSSSSATTTTSTRSDHMNEHDVTRPINKKQKLNYEQSQESMKTSTNASAETVNPATPYAASVNGSAAVTSSGSINVKDDITKCEESKQAMITVGDDESKQSSSRRVSKSTSSSGSSITLESCINDFLKTIKKKVHGHNSKDDKSMENLNIDMNHDNDWEFKLNYALLRNVMVRIFDSGQHLYTCNGGTTTNTTANNSNSTTASSVSNTMKKLTTSHHPPQGEDTVHQPSHAHPSGSPAPEAATTNHQTSSTSTGMPPPPQQYQQPVHPSTSTPSSYPSPLKQQITSELRKMASFCKVAERKRNNSPPDPTSTSIAYTLIIQFSQMQNFMPLFVVDIPHTYPSTPISLHVEASSYSSLSSSQHENDSIALNNRIVDAVRSQLTQRGCYGHLSQDAIKTVIQKIYHAPNATQHVDINDLNNAAPPHLFYIGFYTNQLASNVVRGVLQMSQQQQPQPKSQPMPVVVQQ